MSRSNDVVIDTSELRFIEGHGRLTVRQQGNDMVAEFQNLEGPRFLTRSTRATYAAYPSDTAMLSERSIARARYPSISNDLLISPWLGFLYT